MEWHDSEGRKPFVSITKEGLSWILSLEFHDERPDDPFAMIDGRAMTLRGAHRKAKRILRKHMIESNNRKTNNTYKVEMWDLHG